MIESTNPLVWHEELPILVTLASTVMKMKEDTHSTTGSPWKSKQWLPASSFSVEETVNVALGVGDKFKSLQHTEHCIVRRGDFPICDSVLDDMLKILRKELADMIAYQHAYEKSTASSSVGGVTAAVAANHVIRKRSYSRVGKDDMAEKSRKGSKKARVGVTMRDNGDDDDDSPQSRCSAGNRGRSSDQLLPVAASSKGIAKWQIDKLMDWMKENHYNSSPNWQEIDGLVESTGMKPSQIVSWAAEMGGSIAKLRSCGPVAVAVATETTSQEVITIDDDDDDDSVPELSDEKETESLEATDDELIAFFLGDNEDGDAWKKPIADDDASEYSGAKYDHSGAYEPTEDEYGALLNEYGANDDVAPNILEAEAEAKMDKESMCSEFLDELELLGMELGFELKSGCATSSAVSQEILNVSCGAGVELGGCD